jgi:ubiquinone/menaquinone biosynthesis C-methylase UbiE
MRRGSVKRGVWEKAQSGHLEVWAGYAKSRDQHRSTRDRVWTSILAKVAAAAPIQPGEKILDIGCGLDTVLDYIEGVRGFTLDSLTHELAAFGLSEGIAHVSGLFERMPFGDDGFDRVFLMNVLDHVQTPRAGLAEIARVLRPGGVLVISVDTYRGGRYRQKRLRKWWDRRRGARTKHPWVFSDSEVQRLLRRVGLEPSDPGHVSGTKARRSFLTAVKMF